MYPSKVTFVDIASSEMIVLCALYLLGIKTFFQRLAFPRQKGNKGNRLPPGCTGAAIVHVHGSLKLTKNHFV